MDVRYAMLLVLLLVIPAVSAAGNEYGNQLLNPTLKQIECKTTFGVGYIISLVKDGPNATSLSQYVTTLQSDQAQLQIYANNGDVDGFRNYVRSTYDPDFKSAGEAIVSWRVSERKELTNDTKATLKADYQSLVAIEQTCYLDAVKSYVNVKVSIYTDDLTAYQDRIANLSSKGVDTSALSSLMSEAQHHIVIPLHDAVNSAATTSSQVMDALGEYCMYDGCKSGMNFHLAAKFEIAKLSAIMAKLKVNATGNAAGDVTTAQNDINTAQTALNAVGTAQYGPGQSDQVWNAIDAAADALKQLLRDLRDNSSG